MSTRLKDNDLGNIIRQKLDNIEFKYNHNDWLKLENNLPKHAPVSDFISTRYGHLIILASSIAIIAFVAFYFFSRNNENQSFNNKLLQNNSGNNVAVVSPQNNNVLIQNDESISNKKVNQNIFHPGSKAIINAPKPVINNELFLSDNQATIIQDDQASHIAIQPVTNSLKVPKAEFYANLTEGCEPMMVRFYPVQKSDTIFYLWHFGDSEISTDQAPVHKYSTNGNFTVSLTVKYFKSNKKSTVEKPDYIFVKQSPDADFDFGNSNNVYSFRSDKNSLNTNKWMISDILFSSEPTTDYTFTSNGIFNISHITCQVNGCCDTVSKAINVKVHHNIIMPKAFSPNGDGKNDYFGPVGEKLEDLVIVLNIYNKAGILVYSKGDYPVTWDGRITGSNQPAQPGIYVWKLIITDKYGNIDSQMGSVTILP